MPIRVPRSGPGIHLLRRVLAWSIRGPTFNTQLGPVIGQRCLTPNHSLFYLDSPPLVKYNGVSSAGL